jgi:hypothetical protein
MSQFLNTIKPPPILDENGNYSYSMVTGATDTNLTGVCYKIPDRIIPVVFVPGVMGTNLKGSHQKTKPDSGLWRLDSSNTLLWWLGRGATMRRNLLSPSVTEVDDGGWIDHEDETDNVLFPSRRGRNWGEVAWMSYGEFLIWLQGALNDFDSCQGGVRDKLISVDLQADWNETPLTKDEVALSYKYLYPVHACGYNWLDSNAVSAERLNNRITEIKNNYQSKGKKCEKVIIITHSMGGLVARYYSQYLSGEQNILGIVHGVMPSVGAAATYTRMKSGAEGNGVVSHIAKTVMGETEAESIINAIGAKILGENAAEMTAVLSQSPGPLQLLPGTEYGLHWLKFKAGNQVCSKPKTEPFEEIYSVRGKWWSLCEDHLINPNNTKHNKIQMDKDWESYFSMLTEKVQPVINDLQGKFHKNTYAFYSGSDSFLSYGDVKWHAVSPLVEAKEHMDNILNAPLSVLTDLSYTRQVCGVVSYNQESVNFLNTFRMSQPEEPGDGTVPFRSGCIPYAYLKSCLEVSVGHEPAYKNSDKARDFVLRAVVKITQSINETSLAYK